MGGERCYRASMRALASASAASLLVLLALGCGSSDEDSGDSEPTEDASDGNYHPMTESGVPTTEDLACQRLIDGAGDKLLALGCPGTSPICPDFLRSQFVTACLEYDEGSVSGCVEYIKGKKTCDAVRTALTECAITPFAGSEPAGCPAM